jgi:hypothetical protein
MEVGSLNNYRARWAPDADRGWVLQEVCESGEIKSTLSPEFGVDFTAFKLQRRYVLYADISPTDHRGSTGLRSENRKIHAKLMADEEFVLVGLNRPIGGAFLEVSANYEGDETETCNVRCDIFTMDDFGRQLREYNSALVISITLKRASFERINEVIAGRSDVALALTLRGAAGFYGHPYYEDEGVKVLADISTQRIEIPDGCDSKPEVVGRIDGFTLNIYECEPKQDVDVGLDLDE